MQEFLAAKGVQVAEEVNCKKVPIDSEGLEAKLPDLGKVFVTKGKKLLELHPKNDVEEILKTAIGRSGNLRAPSIQRDDVLIVGFSEEAYASLI